MSKSNANASQPSAKETQRQIVALLDELRQSAVRKDVKEGKRIRRALRALGHRGGLRQNAPVNAPRGKKSHANAA